MADQPLNMTANQAWFSFEYAGAGSQQPNSNEFPIDLSLIQGYYASQNISSAVPLLFFTSSNYIAYNYTTVTYYVFKPLSDSTTLFRKCCTSPANLSISYQIKLGPCCYYVNNFESHSSFALSSDTYTIEVFDMWGRVVLGYFGVTNPITKVTTSATSTAYATGSLTGSLTGTSSQAPP